MNDDSEQPAASVEGEAVEMIDNNAEQPALLPPAEKGMLKMEIYRFDAY